MKKVLISLFLLSTINCLVYASDCIVAIKGDEKVTQSLIEQDRRFQIDYRRPNEVTNYGAIAFKESKITGVNAFGENVVKSVYYFEIYKNGTFVLKTDAYPLNTSDLDFELRSKLIGVGCGNFNYP